MYVGLMILDRNTYSRDTSAWAKCLWGWDGYWNAKRHKSTGNGQFPADLIKAGSTTIRFQIHKLIRSIWNKEELPEEWTESITVPIYEKGDKTNCSNYSSMSRLSTMYKILSTILSSRLSPYAEEIIGDHQCGFRRQRSTTDYIFCIRRILEKKRKNNEALYILQEL
jgi:hypothetical protein